MNNLLQDVRYAVRMMLKQPVFTLIAVITLALGIGANTAIFSVVNALLLSPLQYEDSDKIVSLNERNPQMESSVAYPNFEDWRKQNTVFENIGIYNRSDYNLTGNGDPERIRVAQMSADIFSALRVKALHGRVYTNDEDKPGATPVVVLSYGLWQRRFGGNTNILNQQITLNGTGFQVIGIMSQDYQFPNQVEMWVSAGRISDNPVWKNRGNHPGLTAIARLKQGVTLEQARSELDTIAARLEQEYPDTNKGYRVNVRELKEVFFGKIKTTLWMLLGAVGFVLLIACANVANLLLSRAAGRQKEIAVRTALGASRWRIVQQLLTESVLLGIVGGCLGLFFAYWGLDLILSAIPDTLPQRTDIKINSGVLVFTFAISIFTGILFGLIPAIQSSRAGVQNPLKETGRSNSTGRSFVRNALVVTEVALTIILLVGAGLLLRSFYQIMQVNMGFNHENLLSLKVSLPSRKYNDNQKQINFFNQLTEKIRVLPGVQDVGMTTRLPLSTGDWQTLYYVDGQAEPARDQMPLLEAAIVSADYFRAMDIQLIKGRYFNEQDNRDHLNGKDLSKVSADLRGFIGVNTTIVDEEFAKRHWANDDPLGKQIRLGGIGGPITATIVGVVRRVKVDNLKTDSNRVQAYFHFQQLPTNQMVFVVRTQIQPEQMTTAIRQQVASLDSEQPIYAVRTVRDVRDESVASERISLFLLGFFAFVALFLAVIGIYGVLSYSVTQRTHEVGIRMALGAQRQDILKLIIGQGMKLAFVGIVIGLIGAFALTRLMEALLFGILPTDLITYFAVMFLLGMVAFLACWIPARRATKVEPMNALRYE